MHDLYTQPETPLSGLSAPRWIHGAVEPLPQEIAAFLDEAATRLRSLEAIPSVWASMTLAVDRLHRASTDAAWHERLRQHPIGTLLLEEPATAWAFRRPRGYAGDAHLIDFVYEHAAVRDEFLAATPAGRAMNAMVLASPAPVAVQERRRLLARLLDATAARVTRPEALVLACGHLREAEYATTLHHFDRLVALDQDSESIAEMRRCYSGVAALLPVEASIGRMIVRPLVHGRFDLIYAAGLFDYLDEVTAARLTNGMLSALKPGGRLLFANFCTGVPDYGYMDAFMDWRLIQRDEPEMQRLIDALPAADIARTMLFRGVNRAVIYALVQKR
jgi:SAM-dependent methyltransferase